MADFIADGQGNVKDVRASKGRDGARIPPWTSPAVGACDWWRQHQPRTTLGGWIVVISLFLVVTLGIGCLLDLLAGRNPFEWSREKSSYERWQDEHWLDIYQKRRELESEEKWRYDPERRARALLGLPELASDDDRKPKPLMFGPPQTKDPSRRVQEP